MQHDKIKTEYCIKENIELIRIKYDDVILQNNFLGINCLHLISKKIIIKLWQQKSLRRIWFQC